MKFAFINEWHGNEKHDVMPVKPKPAGNAEMMIDHRKNVSEWKRYIKTRRERGRILNQVQCNKNRKININMIYFVGEHQRQANIKNPYIRRISEAASQHQSHIYLFMHGYPYKWRMEMRKAISYWTKIDGHGFRWATVSMLSIAIMHINFVVNVQSVDKGVTDVYFLCAFCTYTHTYLRPRTYHALMHGV